MAAGIVAAKSLEARRAALEQECVELERRIAERDEELAFMAGRVADLEAARAGAVVPTVTGSAAEAPAPAAKAAAPADPAAAAWAKEDVELSGLAIYSREPGAPETGSRRFWREQVDRLGRHLLPDATPGDQLSAALRDGRGKDFVLALQQCLM